MSNSADTFTINLFLDKRRALKSGKYPLKLRIFDKTDLKRKDYSTNYKLSEKEYNSVFTARPQKHYKDFKIELQALENKAYKVARELSAFSFKDFEFSFYRKPTDKDDVFYHYNLIIKKLIELEKFGTASNYKMSMRSILEFAQVKYAANENDLYETEHYAFNNITPIFLTRYKKWMLDNGKSISTVGIYLRPLRAVFNAAIELKDISRDIYPFGKNKFQIPTSTKVKKALTKQQLSILWKAKPSTPEQQKAKDFWFLSYACNGMNLKDILHLKQKNIDGETIEFIRAKTKDTSQVVKPIVVYLNEISTSVIEKYGTKYKSSNQFIFDFLSHTNTAKQNHRIVTNFIRSINQNLKKLAIANDLPKAISTYWARHSYATNSIQAGASMEFVSEALGHTDLKTTKAYFAGFTDETKKELSNKLIDFL